jgi:hypothetical protein
MSKGAPFQVKLHFFVENMYFNVEDSSSEDLFYAHFNKDIVSVQATI